MKTAQESVTCDIAIANFHQGEAVSAKLLPTLENFAGIALHTGIKPYFREIAIGKG
jgi:hypothetical protein